jgi:hypothetical protein
VLSGGRGELRRMLRRLRGCVYGSLEREAGMVVRRRAPGVCGVCDGLALCILGVVAVLPSKDGAPFCSTADMGGVAVMEMELGKRMSFAVIAVTAGDIGCAVRGVSRRGPPYGMCMPRPFAVIPFPLLCVWRRRFGLPPLPVRELVGGESFTGVDRSTAVA